MPNRLSFFLLLFVGFLDYMGMGLIFPLFASLLFDPSISPLAPEASGAVRGLWMGVLIALSPFIQLFFSPILGSLSDQRGRKSVIILGLAIGLLGYLTGILGIKMHSLSLLILYRIFFGVSASTVTVIQAALVDISSQERKIHNFGLYNMALGVGFTFGPFLGGRLSDSTILSWFDYSTPFLFGAILTALNLILFYWKFSETRPLLVPAPIDVFKGLRQAKNAFKHPTLRLAFLSFFLFLFGWDYFMEFVGVTLQTLFNFTTSQIGNFHAYNGLSYAISAGFLIRPFIKRYSTRPLLNYSMVFGGLYLFLFLLIRNPGFFLLFLPGFNFFISFFFPVASTYVSDHASKETQGETLGIYHSIQAVALILSPLISGSLVGLSPAMPIYLGGGTMLFGGLVFGGNRIRERRKVLKINEGI